MKTELKLNNQNGREMWLTLRAKFDQVDLGILLESAGAIDSVLFDRAMEFEGWKDESDAVTDESGAFIFSKGNSAAEAMGQLQSAVKLIQGTYDLLNDVLTNGDDV